MDASMEYVHCFSTKNDILKRLDIGKPEIEKDDKVRAKHILFSL